MHHIRDSGEIPVPPPSGKMDIVIIGGGLSGLTAAYQLRNDDFLLLEREPVLGGNAKQSDYKGIAYAMGSAYLVDVDEPFGPFYSELGIHPNPVPSPTENTFLSGQWTTMETGPLAKAFEGLRDHFARLIQSPDFPTAPIQKASASMLKLDRISFYDYLKNDYPEQLLECADAYCYSALGGGTREISAYAGVNFYSEIATQVHAFPGGNAYVAQRLIRQVDAAGSKRVRTGVSVYNVTQRNGEVLTSFFNSENPEERYTIASKAVILAVPYFFVPCILSDMPQEMRQVMRSMQYGAYLVANCCFNRQVFEGGYDNWHPTNPEFTDFVQADYVANNGNTTNRNSPTVLTIYAPFRNPIAGRGQLERGDRYAIAAQIVRSLRQSVSFPNNSLEEVRLTRYGHQLLTSRVGLIETLALMPKQLDRVVLAHSDGQGMAAIESAILEGMDAANRIQGILRS